MTDDLMGPPWQADWTKQAEDNRNNALPDQARDLVMAARAERVTATDPYFRGVDTDRDLPSQRACPGPGSGMRIRASAFWRE